MTQLLLPLHECAIEPLHATANFTVDESLYFVVESAALTETSCLCVQF
jgi:hypothetical protein